MCQIAEQVLLTHSNLRYAVLYFWILRSDDRHSFCSSPQLDEQLFFHASEVVKPEGDDSHKTFQELIVPGDEVEFIVGQNTGTRMNFVAQKVSKLDMAAIICSMSRAADCQLAACTNSALLPADVNFSTNQLSL